MGTNVIVFPVDSKITFTGPAAIRINNNVVESVVSLNEAYSFKIRDKIRVNPVLRD